MAKMSVPYYKRTWGRVQVFAGRAGFPVITFWDGWRGIKVNKLILSTKERREWLFANQDNVLQWVDIATVLEGKTFEEMIALLESGELVFCGEPVKILERK